MIAIRILMFSKEVRELLSSQFTADQVKLIAESWDTHASKDFRFGSATDAQILSEAHFVFDRASTAALDKS